MFFKFTRAVFGLLAGLLLANTMFAQQSFHHTLAPVERVRVQQNRAVKSQPGGATSARAALSSASKSVSSPKTKVSATNPLNHRFLGWNHRVADPVAYKQRFSRPHAASSAAKAPALTGTVALTAKAVTRTSAIALLAPGAAPSSIPGLLTRPSLLAGFLPTAVAAGDLNGDGQTDWVVANGGDDTLWIYFGHGDGTADAPVILPLNYSGPVAIALVDLRQTGTNDIIVAEADGFSLGILTNHGDGTFDPEVNYDLPDSPASIAVGDFNFDGFADVAIGFDGSNSTPVALMTNDGFGGFLPAIPSTWLLTDGPAIDSMAAADVDGDGALDLVVAEHNALNGVAVFHNNMDGTFTLTNQFAADVPAFNYRNLAVALGDVNEDGCADAVVTNNLGAATVFTGSCDGKFVPQDISYPTGDVAQSIALADLTGSGHLDIVTGGLYTGSLTYGDSAGNLLSVLRGDGTGSFSQARVFRGHPSMVSLALADLNGDGKLDVVSANQGDDSISVFVNDGSAGFGDPQGWAIGYTDGTANSPVSGVLFADVNGDKANDMVVLQRPANPGGDFQLSVMLNQGAGSYAAPVRSAVFPDSLYLNGDFALADFRGTGKADFVAIGVDSTFAGAQPFLAFAPSNGDGTYGSYSIVNSPNAGGILAVGDFNKDGRLDAAVLGHANGGTQPSVTIFLGNGDGTFNEQAPVFFGNTQPRYVSAIYAADLHKSGKLDLLVHLDNDQNVSEVYELVGNGDGTFRSPIMLFTNFDAFTVADVNGDGTPDIITCKDPGASSAAFVTPQINIFLGQGNGLFTPGASYSPYNNAADFPTWRGSSNGGQGDCIVADFNGDGKVDIAITQRAQSGDDKAFVQFLSGNGDGTFTPNYNTYPFDKANAPQFAFDANGDGKADFVELDSATASLHVIPSTLGPALQMSFVSMPVVGSTGHGTVTLNAPAASDTSVTISASDSNIFVLPTVNIPAGAVSADFLFGLNPSFDITRTFQITAQVNGSSVSSTGYAGASSPNSQYGLNLNVASLALTAAPGGRSFTDDQISVSSSDGYSTTATLSCSGLPAGLTCQFSPTTVIVKANGTGTANLVVNADSSVALGDYAFNINAGDGVVTASSPAVITVTDATPMANIVSSVHADREDIAPKEKFTCIATVQNTGSAPATNVHVNFGFQGSADLVNLRGTAGTCTTGAAGEMYCDIPTLPAGATVTLTADMTANDIGQILFTMATTGQNTAPSQPVSAANYTALVSDFTMGSDTPTTSVPAGQAASYPLNLAATFASFDRPVTFSCSGLPALASCSFSQNNFVPKAGATVNLTITTKAATHAENIMPDAPVYAWLPLASLLLLGTGGARRKRALVALGILLVLTLGLTGCAGFFTPEGVHTTTPTGGTGGTGGTGTGTTTNPGTPAGTYTVTVTASAGSVQHTTSVTLNVQ